MSFTVAHFGQRADGEPLFSFVAEDVTQRRRAEQALRESELAAAAQDEKSRLARDLHDSVTQALFAASLKAEALTETPRRRSTSWWTRCAASPAAPSPR